MKRILMIILALSFSCNLHAAYTTINGVVLCNCIPNVPPECRTYCKSLRYIYKMEEPTFSAQGGCCG
jgi:hypothetical protein